MKDETKRAKRLGVALGVIFAVAVLLYPMSGAGEGGQAHTCGGPLQALFQRDRTSNEAYRQDNEMFTSGCHEKAIQRWVIAGTLLATGVAVALRMKGKEGKATA